MQPRLIIDLETAALPNASDFLDPVEPAKNLKDPEKIRADIEHRQREQQSNCSLDWNLNRIVCAGLYREGWHEISVLVARDESDERALLQAIAGHLAHEVREAGVGYRPLLVGFCIRRFDVPVIIQRARYLHLYLPRISLKRYDNPHIVDLYDLLTFDEQPTTPVMRRTLSAFCRRFSINVPDPTSGKNVAAMVQAGDWTGVADHCRADVEKTRQLAIRLGVLPAQAA